MKNINTCILFIIIGSFSHIIGTHAKNKTDLTEEYLEQEAQRDLEKLLVKINSRRNDSDVNDDHDDDNKTTRREIDKEIDENVQLMKTRRIIPGQSAANAEDQDRFYKIMHKLASSRGNTKLSLKNDDKSLGDSFRKSFANIKPEIHPAESLSDGRDDQQETLLEVDNVYNLGYAHNENEYNNVMRSSKNGNTFQNHDPLRTRSYLPLSANLEKFNELLHRFNKNGQKHVRTKPGKQESGTDDIHIPYLRSNPLMNKVEKQILDAINNDFNEKKRKRTKVTVLRTDVSDETMYADINDQIDEFVNHFNDDKNDRNVQRTDTYRKNQDAQLDDGKRTRRAARTQAGYTQDPDTCKTYNENLVKLWSNLSKYLNVTEQPDELALHNIAMMVQAYLEHHTQQSPETHKSKYEGPRDKVTEIILRIRKTLEDSQASEAKIVKIIKKYAKPFYGDIENEDCQLVNEEYLQISVGLLFKIYQDNLECSGDDESIAMNKRLILRNTKNKSLKRAKSGLLLISDDDYFNPDKDIYIDSEVFKDFQKEKIPRKRSSQNRRVYRRNRNPKRQDPARRSGIENKKIKTRKSFNGKSSRSRSRNNNLRSDGTKSRCEKIAIRKLTSSLRPVIERFTSLQECQIDNTLRSEYQHSNLRAPLYLYASKYLSDDNDNEENYFLRKPIDKSTRKNTERSRAIESSKTEERQKSPQELVKEDFVRDDGDTWIRKQSNSNLKLSDTEDRTSETTSGNLDTNNDLQSVNFYDDYDALLKPPPLHTNSPLSSIIDIKKIIDRVNNKTSHTKDKEKKDVYVRQRKLVTTTFKPLRNNEGNDGIDYDYYNDNVNHSTESVEEPFQDYTRLRTSDKVLQEKKNTHTYESLSEFIKKARDISLQTPEVTMPFALDNNKGYVELTYLVKYPKILIYRPQFLLKNVIPYDAYVKTANSINMSNNDVRLMKIVRHLPDKSAKVLFETEDYEEPLEIRNVNENLNNRRSVWTRNDILKNNNRPSPSIFNDIGSIIDKLRNRTVQHELIKNYENDELFSSDTQTGTIFTTPKPNVQHDTSPSVCKLITTKTDLNDSDILSVESINTRFSETDSESSQDFSGDPFYLPTLANFYRAHTSTTKPKHDSASFIAKNVWNNLRKIIKSEVQKIVGNTSTVSSNIDELMD
ncbi:unnamed protein product [Spodoptera littoralis]|uniref:Uncharacterized protein n=1 Tax=Spodoptera littoralis TaxID=7109 RepID=A0A9P0I7F7_SPOLI|nr:unnamed protein product [Spodoptera littoralis]CAH1642473.1 unnamed protein product [Spodoptera littoralis]